MKFRIGIDLGGTAIKAGIVSEDYQILAKRTIRTSQDFETACREMGEMVEDLLRDARISVSDLECVGIGTPGFINPESGLLVFSPNTRWHNVPLKEELGKYIPVPIYAGNDANCAVIGEYLAGAGKGYESVLMITLGTGVGGGVILNRKLFSGCDFMGTEFGHTPLVYNGERCGCGINGCFEAYGSVSALIRQTKHAMTLHPDSSMNTWVSCHKGTVNGRTAFDCAKEGDPAALAVVDQFESYVAYGISGFINIFRPQIVLIGGGISAEGNYLLEPIRQKLKNYVFAQDIIGIPPVTHAKLGNAAGTIGAAFIDQA